MKISRKTLINILIIAIVVSFFVTPLGYHSKVLLNRLFSFSPEVIEQDQATKISDYNWQLKDPEWEFFSFNQSEGRVVFINFWASWRLPCAAELQSVQNLYDRYGNQIDFYIISDEEREPVEAFIAENKFDFPLTYLIIGEAAPFEILEPPASYILDKQGYIRVKQEGIADWDNAVVYELIDELISAP